MRKALWVFVILCLVSGVSLLLVSFGLNFEAIAYFLGLGMLCILAAIAYTVGRKPYGYMGLGDFSVLIFFGLVGVLGSYYLYADAIQVSMILPALSCGFFSIGVLNVNNIRDIESDKKAGKFSIPVRIGKKKATIYHWFLLISALFCAVLYSWIEYQSPWQYLFLLTLPLFLVNGRAVQQKASHELDPYLKQLALSSLVFVLLFGIGLLLAI
jgi:1,4-dihydroxy-2-naphthoate octaprenyltransferase